MFSALCFSILFSQIMETVEPWYVSKEIIPVIKVMHSFEYCQLLNVMLFFMHFCDILPMMHMQWICGVCMARSVCLCVTLVYCFHCQTINIGCDQGLLHQNME